MPDIAKPLEEAKRMRGSGPAAHAVLMLCPQFRPLVGGYERAAERLSRAVAAAGIEVVVITERRTRKWPAVETADGYEIRRLPCWYRRHLHAGTSLLSFAGFLLRRGRHFDVWHVHQYGFHSALAVALGKVLDRPVLLKLTCEGPFGIGAFGNGMVGKVLDFFHRRVSVCLALSEETRAEAIRLGIPPERIRLIPNGVDGHDFRPATPEARLKARHELGLHCDQLVLNVGRLTAQKNQLGLLEAWAGIDASSRKGALLALVGGGPDRERLEARAQELGVTASVHIAGERSDMATWYRAADFYVLSSVQEGLSNTMIEAMAAGIPVISTRVSGSSVLEAPPAAGLLVDLQDARQLSDAMAKLLRDPQMRVRLGANARQQFDQRFALAGVARAMVGLYAELLGGDVVNSDGAAVSPLLSEAPATGRSGGSRET